MVLYGENMIHTLTLNPVIDLIYCVDDYEKGTTFRCSEFHHIPAGKGINVSYALACMGVPSHAYLVLGESDTALYTQACHERSIDLSMATGDFRVRRHCTILESNTGSVTHVQTKGETIPDGLIGDLIGDLVRRVYRHDIVVLSGSVAPGVNTGVYASIIGQCHAKSVLTILDTSGSPLHEGLKAKPTLLKANQAEAEELTGQPVNMDDPTVIKNLHEENGIPYLLVSFGEEGLLAGCKGGIWKISVPMDSTEVFDTVGCGDAMVAGMAYGFMNELDIEESFQTAIAWASAAALQVGPARLEANDVKEMLKRVKSVRMGDI